jgi:hypothetical protein
MYDMLRERGIMSLPPPSVKRTGQEWASSPNHALSFAALTIGEVGQKRSPATVFVPAMMIISYPASSKVREAMYFLPGPKMTRAGSALAVRRCEHI